MTNPTIDHHGNKYWFNSDGRRHRTDGPACEYTNGNKQWFVNGKFHRTDGPAVEYANGTKAWYINGQRHRDNGPAIKWIDDSKAWYINGDGLSERQFNRYKQSFINILDTNNE